MDTTDWYYPNILVTNHFRSVLDDALTDLEAKRTHPKRSAKKAPNLFELGLNPQGLRCIQRKQQVELLEQQFIEAIKTQTY